MNALLRKTAKFRNLVEACVHSRLHRTPAFVRMIPTDRCNLRCAYCWQMDNDSRDMTREEFLRYLDKAVALKAGLMTFLGGEPMIWPPLYDALRACDERRLLTDLTTNGTLLTPETVLRLAESGLDYLNVSVDGPRASRVTRKNSLFREELLPALRDARARHGMHTRMNSVLYKDNFDDIRDMLEHARAEDIPLSIGFVVPPVAAGQRVPGGIHFGLEDEPRLRSIVDYILRKREEGYPVVDPPAYFRNIFLYLRREQFWECNYPTRYGWVNVAPSGRIRSCTKKMDELELRFLDLDEERMATLRGVLREKVKECNLDCYSNCAYDSYYYTHHKLRMARKVTGRLVRRR